jgi:hypothetical protein
MALRAYASFYISFCICNVFGFSFAFSPSRNKKQARENPHKEMGEEIRISDLRFIRRGPQSVELPLKNKICEFFEIDKRHEQNQREMRNFCE